jgi:hypothetical protein
VRSNARRAQRLRTTVQALPQHTREAMLRGIDENPIIVGAYTDKRGGVCPMLAAHRNGGRTNFASFARAWDAYTGVTKRSRRATRREVQTLRSYLEMSLISDDLSVPSLKEAAREIRAERAAAPPTPQPRPAKRPAAPDERFRVWDLRGRRRRARAGLDLYEATYAAALQEDPAPPDDPAR